MSPAAVIRPGASPPATHAPVRASTRPPADNRGARGRFAHFLKSARLEAQPSPLLHFIHFDAHTHPFTHLHSRPRHAAEMGSPVPPVRTALSLPASGALSKRAARVLRTREAAARTRRLQRAKRAFLEAANARLRMDEAELRAEETRLRAQLAAAERLLADPALRARCTARLTAV